MMYTLIQLYEHYVHVCKKKKIKNHIIYTQFNLNIYNYSYTIESQKGRKTSKSVTKGQSTL